MIKMTPAASHVNFHICFLKTNLSSDFLCICPLNASAFTEGLPWCLTLREDGLNLRQLKVFALGYQQKSKRTPHILADQIQLCNCSWDSAGAFRGLPRCSLGGINFNADFYFIYKDVAAKIKQSRPRSQFPTHSFQILRCTHTMRLKIINNGVIITIVAFI